MNNSNYTKCITMLHQDLPSSQSPPNTTIVFPGNIMILVVRVAAYQANAYLTYNRHKEAV